MTTRKENIHSKYKSIFQPHCPKYPSQHRQLTSDYIKPLVLILILILISILLLPPSIPETNISLEGSSDMVFGGTIFDWPYSYNETSYVSKFSIEDSKVIFSHVLTQGCVTASTQDEQGNIYLTGTTQTTCWTERNDVFVAKLDTNGSVFTILSEFGGSSDEHVFDITLDNQKNIYITGYTGSDDFPVTKDAYNTILNGDDDAFITIISANGSSVLYSSYLGGTDGDEGKSICLDKDKNIYIAGMTYSSDFPVTTEAYDTSYNGGWDVFVTKLSKNGKTLQYSTFLGGEHHEGNNELPMVIDDENNVYVAGGTQSKDYPTTTNAIDLHYIGPIRGEGGDLKEGFISKLSADGSYLLYSTFWGGSSTDRINDIVLVNHSQLYLAGTTCSQEFPKTKVFLSKNTHPKDKNVFITKLGSEGLKFIFSTIIGGNETETVSNIQVDDEKCVYISGFTQSEDFPVTKNAHDTKYNKDALYHLEMYFSKLTPNGKTLLYSTYLDVPSGNNTEVDTINSETIPFNAKISPLAIVIAIVVIYKQRRKKK